jgi:LPS export ABC transporter protein LptC
MFQLLQQLLIKSLTMMPSSFRGSETQETGILAQPDHFLILILSLFLFASCSDLSEYDNQQVQTTLNDTLVTTTESWDIEMLLMKEGNARIFLEGSYAISYQSPDRKETRISGPVYVQLFDSSGAVETEAWSKRAVYLDSESEFELYDSVRVETVTDRKLFTDYLLWSQQTDSITSPRFVTIITPTDSISGRGFSGLTDLSTYVIEEPRGRVRID